MPFGPSASPAVFDEPCSDVLLYMGRAGDCRVSVRLLSKEMRHQVSIRVPRLGMNTMQV